MAKLTADRKEYLKNYKKTKLKRVPLELSMDMYLKLQTHTAINGDSINGFIKKAISEKLERESIPLSDNDATINRFRYALNKFVESSDSQ